MKRKDLYTQIQSLSDVSTLKGVKFSYTCVKNKKLMEEEIKIIEDVITPLNGFQEYESKRIQLCIDHSEKDENGEAKIENDKYKIIDIKVFDGELDILKTEYDKDIEERVKQMEEYQELMEDEIEIDFVKIKVDDLPVDITPIQLESIDFMVDI